MLTIKSYFWARGMRSQADRFARIALANLFWRMFAGIDPYCPGRLGEFVEVVLLALQEVKPPPGENRPDSVVEQWANHLGVVLGITANDRWEADTNYASASQFLGFLQPRKYGINPMEPHGLYHVNGTCLFCREVREALISGLNAVLQPEPEVPWKYLLTVPEKMWPVSLKNWWEAYGSSHSRKAIELRQRIDDFRLNQDCGLPEVAEMLEAMEAVYKTIPLVEDPLEAETARAVELENEQSIKEAVIAARQIIDGVGVGIG